MGMMLAKRKAILGTRAVGVGLLGSLFAAAAVLSSMTARSTPTPSPTFGHSAEDQAVSAPQAASRGSPAVERASAEGSVRSLWLSSPSEGFVGMTSGLFATGDGGRTWVRRLGGVSIEKLTFVDRAHGWALAEAQLFRTTDAGRSWEAVAEPLDPLVDLAFVSPGRGWGATRSGAVAATSDGGAHWVVQRPPGHAGAVCFADPAHGWAAGDGTVETTADGGRHWARAYRLPSVVEPDQGASAHCSSNAVWVLFTGSGAVSKLDYTLVTNTVGTSRWTVRAHNVGFAPEPSLADAPHGVGYGDYSGPFTVLTADLAVLIAECVACSPSEVSVIFADRHDGWVGRSIPALDDTANDVPATPSFIDRNHGWVAGNHPDRGSIIAGTDDGGDTWTVLPSPTG